ncbi:MAG: VCBS repeat-containing protein [Polyangiaceae bacterium]|nr:VCBS repeat-containing protein [Polyangiaceae bacterium]
MKNTHPGSARIRWSRVAALGTLGALAALASPAACRTFEPIDEATCGNAIIDRGEDCDGFDIAGVPCGAVGSAHACRLECPGDPGAQGPCPAGWGCGADGVCRGPSGTFGDAVAAIQGGASLILDGDFDGDGRVDILGVSPGMDDPNSGQEMGGTGHLSVHYFAAGGALAATTTLQAPRSAFPTVGDLSGDGLDDVAVNVGAQGVSLYRGRDDRTFAPSIYASAAIEADGIRVWGQKVLENATWGSTLPGDEALAVVDVGGSVGAYYIDQLAGNAPVLLFTGGPPNYTLPSLDSLLDVPTGDVDEDAIGSPCDEFVLAFKTQDRVLVATPCLGWDTVNVAANPPLRPPTIVTLPAGAYPRSIHLFDLDGDGHLDLLIGTSSAGVRAAYGRGDMTFHSVPSIAPFPPADGLTSLAPFPQEAGGVLAVGHLNQDGIPDYVTANGLWLSGLVYQQPGVGGGGGAAVDGWNNAWLFDKATRAAIGDFNANGLPDAIVIGNQGGLRFFSGAGDDTFNFFLLPTEGRVKDMVVGDYDGDVIPDLAIAVEVDPNSDQAAGGDSLSVVFGGVGAAPEMPVHMGQLGTIERLSTARFMDPVSYTADGISEVAAITRNAQNQISLAVLYGSTGRQLESPFALFTRGASAQDTFGNQPLRTAIGEYSATPGHPDLAAIAQPQSTTEWQPRVWLAEAEGDALLAEDRTRASPPLPSDSVDIYAALLASVDANGDGIEELVGLVPSWDGLTSMLVVGIATDAAGGGRTFAPQEPVESVDGHFNAIIGSGSAVAQPGGFGGAGGGGPEEPPVFVYNATEQRIVVSDVDADGKPDLLVIGRITDAQSAQTSNVVVFWNAGTSDPGTAFTAANRTVLPAIELATLTSVAALNIDGDAERELVVMSDLGPYLIDTTGREFSAATQLANLPWATTVAAADVTGDGLEDLVLADNWTLSVHPQKAVNP